MTTAGPPADNPCSLSGRRGLFISFEGVEGAGKSTQIGLAERFLKDRGCPVRVVREPGGTPFGDRIRALLLDPSFQEMRPLAEFLLFSASRNQLVEQVLEPALAAGEIVLCDRFADSSLAYQGFARGLDLEMLRTITRIATGGRAPDRTLLLDLPLEDGLRRADARRGLQEGADRFEAERLDFHARVREGFLTLAAAHPERIRVIDARGTPDQVAAQIQSHLTPMLRHHGV